MLASELQRMGADITIEGHHAIVRGVDGFEGTQVKSPDLRGGAALVMAGLVAEGETTVSAIHHIDRGYEGFVEKLPVIGDGGSQGVTPNEEAILEAAPQVIVADGLEADAAAVDQRTQPSRASVLA